jgi:hypothetical protein
MLVAASATVRYSIRILNFVFEIIKLAYPQFEIAYAIIFLLILRFVCMRSSLWTG